MGEVFEQVFSDEVEAVQLLVLEHWVGDFFFNLNGGRGTYLVLKVDLVNSSTLKAYSTNIDLKWGGIVASSMWMRKWKGLSKSSSGSN
jgi:hypothetical protein